MLKKCKQNRIRFKCLQKLIFPESFPLPVFDTLSPCTYLQELLWSLLLPIPWQNLMIAGFPIKTRKLVRIMFNIPNKIKYCKLRIWKVETVLSLVRHALLLNTFLTCINEGVFFFLFFFLIFGSEVWLMRKLMTHEPYWKRIWSPHLALFSDNQQVNSWKKLLYYLFSSKIFRKQGVWSLKYCSSNTRQHEQMTENST